MTKKIKESPLSEAETHLDSPDSYPLDVCSIPPVCLRQAR
jgi:hypothetical protein